MSKKTLRSCNTLTLLLSLVVVLSCNNKKTTFNEKGNSASLDRIGLTLLHEPEVDHDILTTEINGVFHDSIVPQVSLNDLVIHPYRDPDYNYYSINNHTYKANNRITYEYIYVKDGDSLKFELLFDSLKSKVNDWRLTPQKSINSSIVHTLELSVVQGRKMFTKVPDDYNQTIIRYNYNSSEKVALLTEYTGVIDNQKNIWIHPPRAFLFKSLVISSWPFIKSPYLVGSTWNWKPKWTDRWSTENWGEYKGELENYCEYEITRVENMKVGLYLFECYVIDSSCKNDLGVFKSTFWFNPNIGFLKLHYENIGGDQIIFDATEIKFGT